VELACGLAGHPTAAAVKKASPVPKPPARTSANALMPLVLPGNDPLAAVEQAGFWLQAYRQSLPSDPLSVYEAVDRLDDLAQPHRLALMREYLEAGGRMQTYREHRLWQAAVVYARALADGYTDCLRLCQQAGARGSGMLVPILAARAMRAHTLELRWALLRYGAVDEAVWSRMGALFALCERPGLAMLRFKIYPAMAGDSTVRREYLRALILSVSAMGNLLPAAQVVAERAIATVAEFFLLHRQPAAGCHFAVDLQAKLPPYRITEEVAPARSVRFFGPGDAGVMLEGFLRQMGGQRPVPAQLGLDGRFAPKLVTEVLQHLARHWGAKPPTRGEARHRVLATAHVAHGFGNVLAAIAGKPGLGEDELTEAWTVENESAGGFGALIPARDDDWLEVGRLVAAKPDWPSAWCVGVIRRVAARNPTHRAVGVEIRARGGVCVQLTPLSGPNGVPGGDGAASLELGLAGILLPTEAQTSLSGGEVELVLPRGSTAQLTACDMHMHGRRYRVGRLLIVDSGTDFEIARFALRSA